MSKINKKHFYIFAILILFSLFVCGCKSNRTAVERIDFNLSEVAGSEISLLVGDEYQPKIEFTPSFVSDKGYWFESSNEAVLKVSGAKIYASAPGEAVLTVVAKDNELIQNTIKVKVFAQPIDLDVADINLNYDELNQKFYFSEVLGAASYTININGNEFELGNNLEFSLDEYAKNFTAYDAELVAKVRANAPGYSHAISSSQFCEPVRVYQVSRVKNVEIAVEEGVSYLSFEHDVATHFSISIDGEMQTEWQNIDIKKIPLMNLPEKFAGKNVQLQISALVEESVGESYPAALKYPSLTEVGASVLKPVELNVNASMLVWNAIPYVEEYKIFVGDEQVATSANCSFNLNDLDAENYPHAAEDYALTVEPILSGNNLATTAKKTAIKFNRNLPTELFVEEETVKWNGDAGQVYYLSLFKDDELVESYATNLNEFDLKKFDSSVYELKVLNLANKVGDVYNLTSVESSIKFSRLKTPILNYNKQENNFSIADENSAENVESYTISFSGNEEVFADKNLADFKPEFAEGDNEFEIFAKANEEEILGIKYLNSKTSTLTLTKIFKPKTVELLQDDSLQHCFNHLKIATDLNSEYVLNLTLVVGEDELNFRAENGSLVCLNLDKEYFLPLSFENGNYYVSLLGANLQPIVDELNGEASSFGVSAWLEGTLNEQISSDKIENEFGICTKIELNKNEQKINFSGVNPSASALNYYLFVNGKILINLDEENVVFENEKFEFNISYLLEKLNALKVNLTGEATLQLVNCFENCLARIGDEFVFEIAQLPKVNSSKNVLNFNVNNGAEIFFVPQKTDYTKQYVFKFYDDETSETIVFNENESLQEIRFNLEQLENYQIFAGKIKVSACVKVLSAGGANVFDSPETELFAFNKLEAANNLKIDNGVLTFEFGGANVAFYELYSVSGNLKTLLATSNNLEFNLTAIEFYEKLNFAVKVVSAEKAGGELFCNSNLSESISAKKMEVSIDIVNGDFVFTINQLNDLKTMFEQNGSYPYAYLEICNETGNKKFEINAAENLSAFNFELGTISLEAYTILNYGVDVSTENLTAQVVVRYSQESEFVPSETYYLNSNVQKLAVNGLIKPSDMLVNYSQDELNNEIVDYIEWSNEKNPANLSYNYLLKLTYKDETYSSQFGTFYYYEDEINLNNTKIKLPTKFVGADGAEVEFEDGEYLLEIKVYPTTNSPENYCSSAYSYSKIKLLPAPVLALYDGILLWNVEEEAAGYQLKISTLNEENNQTLFLSCSDTYFNFEDESLADLDGVLSVEVQALSVCKNERENEILKSVVNSRWSKNLLVYKLPQAETAAVDDGVLVLTANKIFSSAVIEFVYDNTISTYVYNNENAKQELANLGIANWQSAEAQKLATLRETKKYIIDVTKLDLLNNTLNLVEGATYSVFVKLNGSAADINLPIVNSNRKDINLKTTKLQHVEAKAIARGKLNFAMDKNLSLGELNYNFNETEQMLKNENGEFAKIYKINVASNVIYALDYNFFEEKIKTLQAEKDYHIYNEQDFAARGTTSFNSLYGYLKIVANGQEILLNVYRDNLNDAITGNIIDFSASKIYFNSIEVLVDQQAGEFVYSMAESALTEIDLSLGGTFEVNVRLLGGDAIASESAPAHLTSGAVGRYFVRYEMNSLATSNGELRFNDLTKYDELNNPLDYPIYKIVATSTARSKNLYLYYGENNLDQVKSLVNDDSGEYILIEDFQQEQQTKYVWFEISKCLDDAFYYELSIQTLAGLGVNENANYLLSAIKLSSKIRVYKLGKAALSVDQTSGVSLSLTLAERVVRNFEIRLKDVESNEEIIYVIDEHSDGVKLTSAGINYTLPKKVTTIMNKQVELNSCYEITIRAITSEQNVINGSLSLNPLKIKRIEDVSNFKIENGMLKYLAPKKNSGVYVQLNYTQNDIEKSIYFTVNQQAGEDGFASYNFSDLNIYKDVFGTFAEAIVALRKYSLNIYALGYVDEDVCVLNGTFAEAPIQVNRLETVSQIYAENGILTWGKINGAVGYLVSIKFAGQTITERVDANVTSLDLNTLKNGTLIGGEYGISIRALGEEKINAMNSESCNFTKLNRVADNFTLKGNLISWQQVEGADEYYVEFKYSLNGAQQTETFVVETNSCTTPNGLNGDFVLSIQARAKGVKNVLNSQFTQYSSSIAVPNAVELNWDAENYRFKITTASDFGSSDQIEIVAFVTKYQYLNGRTSLSEQEETLEFSIPYNAANNNEYYFYPTAMGQYSIVSARVNREDSLSSGIMIYSDGIDLNIYAAGDGENEAYVISNLEQLKNIKYRNWAKFELSQSINITNISNFSAIIAEEFSGELNGKNFALTGWGAEINNTNFALFKTLNGAKIYNLILGNASNEITATYSGGEINLAVLAANATNSAIQNVTLNNTKLSITGNSTNNVYVAGLVANSLNSNFEGCNVNLSVEFDLVSNLNKYVGGVAAYCQGGKFGEYNQTATTVKLSVNSVSNRAMAEITYLGGLVGCYRSQANAIGEIVGVKTEVEFSNTNARNVGGVAGYLACVNLTNSETSGTISTSVITAQSYINLGGIVGTMQGATLQNSGTKIEFNINLSPNISSGTDVNNNINLGVLAGAISISSASVNNSVLGCYSFAEFLDGQTNLTSSPLVLGVYGYLDRTTLSGNVECERR